MARRLRRVNLRTERSISSERRERDFAAGQEDGNAVRKPAVRREDPETGRKSQNSRKKKPQVSRSLLRANRARAKRMSVGYVVFLGVVCTATVFACIHFLQLKSRLTRQTRQIASLESSLSKLKADNDAYYKKALASEDLDEIREAARDRLGLHTASEDEIRYYNADDNSYVRQYENVTDAE